MLDTGVDFTHVDLINNMWIRPENMPAYTDDELGTFNDLNGFNGTDKITDPMDETATVRIVPASSVLRATMVRASRA